MEKKKYTLTFESQGGNFLKTKNNPLYRNNEFLLYLLKKLFSHSCNFQGTSEKACAIKVQILTESKTVFNNTKLTQWKVEAEITSRGSDRSILDKLDVLINSLHNYNYNNITLTVQ